MSIADIQAEGAAIGKLKASQTTDLTSSITSLQEFIKTEISAIIDGYMGDFWGLEGMYKEREAIVVRAFDGIRIKLEDLTFELPDRPPSLDTEQPEKFKKHVYDAWQLDSLQDKLMNLVTTSDIGTLKELSGVGIDIGLQESMYNYQRSVDQQDLEYELDKLDGKWAQDGYVLPPDALVHNRAWLIARYEEKRTDRTRNIFSEIAKMAQTNVQWAYENGLKIEELHSGFAISYSKIYKDVIDAIVAIYKKDAEMEITKLESKIKKIEAELSIEKATVERDVKHQTLVIEQANERFRGYIQAFSTAMTAHTTTSQQRLEAAKNVTSAYDSILKATAAGYTAINLATQK